MTFFPKKFITSALILAAFSAQAQEITISIDNLRTFQGVDQVTAEPTRNFTGLVDRGFLVVSPSAPLFRKEIFHLLQIKPSSALRASTSMVSVEMTTTSNSLSGIPPRAMAELD